MFGNFTPIGSAEMRVVVDLSQPQASVAKMRGIAEQMKAAIDGATKARNSGGSSSGSVENQFGVVTALNKQMQAEAAAAQKLAKQRAKLIEESRPKTVPEVDSFAKSLTANKFGVVTALNKVMQEEAAAAQKLAKQRAKLIEDSRPKSLPEFDSFIKNNKADALGQAGVITPKTQAAAQQAYAKIQADAERASRQTLLNEIKLTQQAVAEARSKVTQQQARYNVAGANAPSTVTRIPVVKSLAEAKQPIADIEVQLRKLQSTMTALSDSPNEQLKLIDEFRKLRAEANGVDAQINKAAGAITNFQNAAQRSRSGVQGYFTNVRENLERLNETSLAANLQEVSFRLLPIGLAFGAVTKQGVEVAQTIEEMALGFKSFTGDEAQATALMNQLAAAAQKFGLPILEVQTVMQRFLPIIRQTGTSVETVIDLAARLRTLNPAQGFEGALFSITEAMASGEGGLDAVSLRERFGIVPRILRDAIKETGSLTAGLGKVLDEMGRTSELAEQFGDTSRAGMQRMTDAWNNFLGTAMRPTVDGMTQVATTLANILNTMQESGSVLSGIVGGFISLGAAAVSALVAVSQVALGIASINALMPEGAKSRFANFFGRATAAQSAAGTEVAMTGAGRAAGVIGNIAQYAITGTVALAIGAAIGSVVAPALVKALNVGDKNYQDRLQADPLGTVFENFKQWLFIVGSSFIVFSNRIRTIALNIDDAFGLVVASLQKAAISLEAAMAGAWAAITHPTDPNARQNAEQEVWQRNQTQIQVLGRDGNVISQVASPGTTAEETDRVKVQLEQMAEEAGTTLEAMGIEGVRIVEGINEKMNRLQGNLGETGEEVRRNQIMLGEWFQTITGTPVGGTTTTTETTTTPKTFGLNDETLDKAYGLLVNDMIQQTRRAEDEARAAAREVEDFMRSRTQALADFSRQQALALEDFQRDRQGRIDDFNNQVADEEKDNQKQRKKQIDDFNEEEKRRQEDHLRDMMRSARDVDDAISARDFLAAQKALQKMSDDEEDFKTEEQRRKEDQAKQLDDLEENLKEQKQKRQEDFARQLREMDENFARQRARERDDFNLRLAREDQERAIRLAREAQDREIARQREWIDFQIQIAQLQDHNNIMQQIWNGGLGVLRQSTVDFFTALGQTRSQTIANAAAQLPNYPAQGGAGWGTGGSIGSFRGLGSFAQGAWRMPSDQIVRVHQDELIMPAPYADDFRSAVKGGAGGGSLGAGGGGLTIAIDARGATMNEAEFVRLAEEVIVPKVTKAIERGARDTRNRRGA